MLRFLLARKPNSCAEGYFSVAKLGRHLHAISLKAGILISVKAPARHVEGTTQVTVQPSAEMSEVRRATRSS